VRRTTAVAAGLSAAAAVVWPASASAHGLVGREDLPIPTWLFGWAASIVLIVSFVALATLWREPRLERPRERRLFRVPAWVDPLCGALGVALFGLVVYAGLEGTTDAKANLASNVVFVLFWVGLVLLSVLLGDVFRAFNPWRAVARAVGWAGARAGIAPRAPRAYPDRLGRWPAAATVLGFAWLELVYVQKTPQTLAWLCVGYAVVQLCAMAVFGVRAWTEHGDGFSVYFNLFSRLSPLVRRDGVLHLRPPLAGAPGMPVVAGSVAVLCAAIGTTTFDGFSNGPVWASLNPDLQSVFTDLGFSATVAFELAGAVGIVACVAAVALFYRLGIRGMETVGGGHSGRELAGRFAHTLIPIAFAYAVAHYFSLLAFNGQAVAFLISDPLGDGSDIFGTAHSQIHYFLSSNGIWLVQVGALVVGHVSGLVLAHDRALGLYTRVREATRSQYWMLVVMVGFTSLGLWLLSAVRQ
jgi:hypothetical protein